MTEKRWDKQEIEKAVRILKEAENKKTGWIKALDKSVYWVFLIVAILGNIAVSVMLIPILLVLRSFMLYFVIAVLGASFGFFFDLLIRDMEHLEKRHHVIAGFFVPMIAVVNMAIVTVITNRLEITLKLNNDQHSLLLVGFVYATAFILPYLYYNFVKKK